MVHMPNNMVIMLRGAHSPLIYQTALTHCWLYSPCTMNIKDLMSDYSNFDMQCRICSIRL